MSDSTIVPVQRQNLAAMAYPMQSLDPGTSRPPGMFSDSCFDEMYAPDRSVRPHYGPLSEWLVQTAPERIAHMRQAAQMLFHRVGITFAVYGEESGAERLIPFDILPHIIPGSEWRELSAGLKQRVRVLNMFLHDIYHGQEIIKAGKIPSDKVLKNAQ